MRRLLAFLLLAGLAGCSAPATPTHTTPVPPPRPVPTPSAAETPQEVETHAFRRPDGMPNGIDHFTAPIWSYKVKNRFPHDTQAFTQGLLVSPEGTFYEGTGLEGRSEVREVEVESGKVLRKVAIRPEFFGEGLCQWHDSLIELTWKSKKALLWGRKDFKPQGQLAYEGEGWGLTAVGDRLLMSNGSNKLTWRDPKTFASLGEVEVKDGDTPVPFLNELEMVGDDLYANVWTSEFVIIVDPKTGKVKAWLDLRGLLDVLEARNADVLNGVAYDAKRKRLFVTGKLWPKVFEIEVVDHP